jgi:hypothetical protein
VDMRETASTSETGDGRGNQTPPPVAVGSLHRSYVRPESGIFSAAEMPPATTADVLEYHHCLHLEVTSCFSLKMNI